MIVFRVAPGEVRRVPLVIGTEPLRPSSVTPSRLETGESRRRSCSAQTSAVQLIDAPQFCRLPSLPEPPGTDSTATLWSENCIETLTSGVTSATLWVQKPRPSGLVVTVVSKLRASWFLIACCAGLICIALPSAAYGSSAGRGSETPNPTSSLSKPVAPHKPAGPPPIKDSIETTATSAGLASAYGGQVVNADGTVTVYVTPSGMSRMNSALTKAVGSASSKAYTLKEVPHSFAELEALTMRLDAHQASLKHSGIDMVWCRPNTSSNTVLVKILNYSSSAARALQKKYGRALLTVRPFSGNLPTRTSNRYYDNSPFYNGDRIWFNNSPNGAKCTDGFAFTGNNSGNVFETTAGHCGGSSVWTNYTSHYEMGSVSTNYFNSTGGNYDLESFRCGCASPVWYEGPSIGTAGGYIHNVVGQCVCGKGQYVTADGATTGESTGNYVNNVNICVEFGDGKRPAISTTPTTPADTICANQATVAAPYINGLAAARTYTLQG